MIISHKALEVLMFTRRLYLVSVGNVKSRFFSTEVPVDLRGCVVIHKCSTLAQAVVIPLRQKFHWLTSLKKKKFPPEKTQNRKSFQKIRQTIYMTKFSFLLS